MSVALFVESQDYNDSTKQEQTILVSLDNSLKVFHRISTGKRGRSEAWQLSTLGNLPDTLTTAKPVAVRLTGADLDALRYDRITGIAVKALTASEAHQNQIPEVAHNELVSKLSERLLSNDTTLAEFITDPRFNDPTSVFLSPVTKPIETTTRSMVSVGENVIELATIPDDKWGKNYLNRKIVGDLTEFDIYDEAMRTKTNVLIKGHAGSGKTMSVCAYANKRGLKYYSVSASAGTSVDQLLGKFVPDPKTQHFHWVDGAVTYLFRHGGVLLLNEINFLPERITTVLFSGLDDRREIQLMDKDGEVIKAHPNLLIVGDMNPGYKGTRPMNQAWADRFRHVLDFPYDETIERQLIPNKGIREMAKQLRDSFDKEELSTPISTRALVGFLDNLNNLGFDYALYAYLNTFASDKERAGVKLVADTHRDNIVPVLRVADEAEAI